MAFAGMSLAELLRLLLPLVVLESGLKAYCLISLSRNEASTLPKWAWALIILFVSTFGPLAYLIFGRRKDRNA
ncbi:MAG: PLD nuclease N-terminal domain-containing protein [Firmicutes bacterium]|jgi:hypothetical protein|nr:PLD nuclease N-terminal domain-containing protein [Bacillota bacterium]